MKWDVLNKVLMRLILATCIVVIAYALCRICICDRFVVRGESMTPSLEDGEPVYVHKLIFGGRI